MPLIYHINFEDHLELILYVYHEHHLSFPLVYHSYRILHVHFSMYMYNMRQSYHIVRGFYPIILLSC